MGQLKIKYTGKCLNSAFLKWSPSQKGGDCMHMCHVLLVAILVLNQFFLAGVAGFELYEIEHLPVALR